LRFGGFRAPSEQSPSAPTRLVRSLFCVSRGGLGGSSLLAVLLIRGELAAQRHPMSWTAGARGQIT
jgi:hypothetical protein